MNVSPETMRLLLVLCLLGMQILAAFFLRRRQLSLQEYLGWGLLIVFLPALGPFLAILFKPGRPAARTIRRRSQSLYSPVDLLRKFALRIRLTKP
jgi:hypothetical protein